MCIHDTINIQGLVAEKKYWFPNELFGWWYTMIAFWAVIWFYSNRFRVVVFKIGITYLKVQCHKPFLVAFVQGHRHRGRGWVPDVRGFFCSGVRIGAPRGRAPKPAAIGRDLPRIFPAALSLPRSLAPSLSLASVVIARRRRRRRSGRSHDVAVFFFVFFIFFFFHIQTDRSLLDKRYTMR